MKKLFFSLLLVMLLAAPVWAKTYSLSTSTTTTGATTVANGGTSPFGLDGVATYDLYPQLDRTYAYGFQLTGVSPSQAVKGAGTAWSGTTFSVKMKFKSESDDVPWDAVAAQYLIKNMPVSSGNTPYMVWLNAPPADRARAYFETSGPISFDVAQGKLIASQIPVQVEQKAILLGVLTFNLTATTGTSSFASTDSLGKSLPEGTGCVVMENCSQSGATIIHNQEAATINRALESNKSISGADIYVYDTVNTNLKDIRVGACQAVSLKVYCYDRRSY